MCLLEVAMCEKCRSSHFQSEGRVKSLRIGEKGGVKNFRTGGMVTDLGGLLLLGRGVSTPLHAMYVVKFWKLLGLFVKNRSIIKGFTGFLQNFVFFTRFLGLCIWQKVSIVSLVGSKLKSTRRSTFIIVERLFLSGKITCLYHCLAVSTF